MKLRWLIFISVTLGWLTAAPAARAWWLIDQLGQLSQIGQGGEVLGDEDRERESSSGRSEDRRKLESGSDKRKDETKTEIRFSDENRIKTEFKPQESKTEIRQGENRIKFERKDGEIRIKIKNEATGEEREVEIRKEAEEKIRVRERREFEQPEIEDGIETETEPELLRIREREDRNEIRVESDNGRFVIKRNRVGAVSEFPLSIDLSTNTLFVTTPAGEKQVTILPDQAVQNMLSRNVIDRIGGQEVGGLNTRVKMSQKSDGTLIYEVEGEKQERLFGFLPMKFKKTAVVSAETGELIETKQAFTGRILEFISF